MAEQLSCEVTLLEEGQFKHVRPHLQRSGERRCRVQTEAPRRAPRPGNTFRPGLIIISVIVVLSGADTAAEEENSPER